MSTDEQNNANEGRSRLTAGLGYWTDFKCPKCGSGMFGSARNDDGTWTRHCHGNEQWKCDFTAHDSDDSKHFKTFVPNI